MVTMMLTHYHQQNQCSEHASFWDGRNTSTMQSRIV